MGRFDALTQLDNKPASPTSPSEKPEPTKTPVTSSLSEQRKPLTGLPANMQTSKDTSMQAPKPVNTQTRLHANQQTDKHAVLEKYSTYLTPECKRGLKRLAFEADRKDYEVLIEAVEQYLEKQKPLK